MNTTRFPMTFRPSMLAAAVVMALAGASVHAQISTATLKGQVSLRGAPVKESTQVTARNLSNGVVYRAVTRADGSYTMPGLMPGSYEVRVQGSDKPEVVTVGVGDNLMIDLSLTNALEKVVIVGSSRQLPRTSEVGTSVSTTTLERLPQINRNFLSFADLSPGVRAEGSTIRGGASSTDHSNVFIDGVSQKNYALPGGVSGRGGGSWSSPGNPFPQNAVAEYKVISQNYKAEYDQLSSVAVTAVTKSGSNELRGDVFWDYTNDKLTAKGPFERKKEQDTGVKRPPFTQNQYGFSVGGPIILDRLHYFVSYEGKSNETPWQTRVENDAGIANGGVMPSLRALAGAGKDNFKENLLFARLDWALSEDQRMEITLKSRDEKNTGVLAEGSATKSVKNEETRFSVKHILSRNDFTNEALLSFEDTLFHPFSGTEGPSIRYLTKDWATIFVTGGVRNRESKGQTAVLFQDDVTYTGLASHTIKFGAKLKRATFDLTGSEKSEKEYLGFVGADGLLIDTALNPTNILTTPYGKLFETPWSPAVAPGTAKYRNSMFGLYIQDDWRVTKALELNLGIRWDFESNMLNNGYTMPADRAAALLGPDTRTINGAKAPAGQTYAQSLAKGGINISDYIGTGNRKAFKGAFAPRLGFTYDLAADRSIAVFGGWGRAYDRAVAEAAQLEAFNNQSAKGGEIWGLRNDYKMPYSDQLSLGLRQQLSQWNAEVAVSRIEHRNHLIMFSGNRDFNGGFASSAPADPLWGGPDGWGNLVLGDFVGRSKTDTFYVKLDKPYSGSSGWGASVAYTHSSGKTTNAEGESDNRFSWTSGPGGKFAGTGFHDVNEVERHRLIATGMVDLPYDLLLSGKMTWGSGLTYTAMTCDGPCRWYPVEQASTMQVDASLAKRFQFGSQQSLTLRVDVINLFNRNNYSGYGRFPWDWNSLQPSATGAMRQFKLGVRYGF